VIVGGGPVGCHGGEGFDVEVEQEADVGVREVEYVSTWATWTGASFSTTFSSTTIRSPTSMSGR
jgi:hypothetical protein